MNGITRNIYRVIRAIVFTVLIMVVAVPVILYILLSLKPVQNRLRDFAQNELSTLTGADVSIGDLSVTPFNKVSVKDVCLVLDGDTVAGIDRLSAGLNIWDLISRRRITVSYAALVGMDASICRDSAGAPLNIQPIIDRLAGNDPDKPKSKINLRVNTVILRNINFSYDVADAPPTPGLFNPGHISVSRLRCDASIPLISDSLTMVSLKRLDFIESSGLRLEDMTANVELSPHGVKWTDLKVELPSSRIFLADGAIDLPLDHAAVSISKDSHIYLPSLSSFSPLFNSFPYTLDLSLDAAVTPGMVDVNQFRAVTRGGDLAISLSGTARADSAVIVDYDIPELSLSMSRSIVGRLKNLRPSLPFPEAGYTAHIKARGNGLTGAATLSATAPEEGNFDFTADFRRASLKSPFEANLSGGGCLTNLGNITRNPALGEISVNLSSSATWLNQLLAAQATIDIERLNFKGHTYRDIAAEGSWNQGNFKFTTELSDSLLDLSVEASGILGLKSVTHSINLIADIDSFDPNALHLTDRFKGMTFSTSVEAALSDFDPASVTGHINLDRIAVVDSLGKLFNPGNIAVIASGTPDQRLIALRGDIISGSIRGTLHPQSLPQLFSTIARHSIPALTSTPADTIGARLPDMPVNHFDFDFTIKPTESLRTIFSPPVTSLYPVTINGNVDSSTASARVEVDAPYLRQGDKIIEETSLKLAANGISSAKRLVFSTRYPSKDGLTTYNLTADGIANVIDLALSFDIDRKARYDGAVRLLTRLDKSPADGSLIADVSVQPSELTFNDSTWSVAPSNIRWADNTLNFDRFNVSRNNQFVKINGTASASESDTLAIDIRNFDLGYLFDALNIDNVPLGGFTTGSVTATSVLTPAPHATASGLFVKDISFGGCVIGDALVNSRFDPENLAIIINGDITQANGLHSGVDVDLRPASQELDVNIVARHTPVGFLDQYFSAFADNVKGTATGNLRVFGTFQNVDLEGRLDAENVAMRMIFSNVVYHASDSIIITPGRINVPALAVSDFAGHTATLSGAVTHRNFEDFKIDLAIDGVKDMLVFNVPDNDTTNYFGKVFASGSASIKGDEELIKIAVDATTSPGSLFTFKLDDREIANEYTFLTFRDKNAATDTVAVTVDENLLHIERLRRLFQNNEEETSGNFAIELLVNVTPDAELDLVMDPMSGDKIRAFGNGDLRLTYDSADDKMEMFGNYTVDRGFYNFTIQEIIIKDLTIEQGSRVSFSGDPLDARLDIKAYYSLNANLTDLDESFARDKDLNRTNVPVHAVLIVTGDIHDPQLSFDIEFPTLTSDVYRKVRSIVSTEEMMNRQIIYLLALNRFYTPDYMSTTKGNELFSVASSTITSQLSNILGQLSDKWMIAPNLRSDRGDFSDVEVDLALSSRLLNNRLLLNGNFGYRDKSLNTNQFIGDFDIEYLLNRQGTIRLKAYNHYNDQNYYVRTATTTQGVGIMFKHDFDNIFGFLRRTRHPATIHPSPAVSADSIAPAVQPDALPQSSTLQSED